MATTPAAARVTEVHRQAQIRLGAQTVSASSALWRLLDPADLDGSFERWLPAMTRLIRTERATSAALAARYVRTFKALEVPGAPAPPLLLADRIAAPRVATSLLVTGPVAAKRAIARGTPAAAAMAHAESIAASAALRHVLDGGRSTIVETVASDPQALGWARAASANACAFCAMLAGRGPVYGEGSVDFDAHDGCGCTAEPVYSEASSWPHGSNRYADLWTEAAGNPIEFRALIEGRA